MNALTLRNLTKTYQNGVQALKGVDLDVESGDFCTIVGAIIATNGRVSIGDHTFIAHEVDGAQLPADHGGPARLLVPHLYLWKSAKWIQRLEVLPEDRLGFWEMNGYHHRGDPWREERHSVSDYVARTLRREARGRPDRPA